MAHEYAVDPVIEGESHTREDDAVIAALAARQHGVVARRQLLALGLGAKAIDHRVRCGRLHLLHRGVYAVGHRLVTKEGRWMAAVLAAGPAAVLSHRSAAALWGIRQTAALRVEVTAPKQLHPRPGLLPHCRYLRKRGTKTLRALLLNARRSTRSPLEAEFLGFVDEHGLPSPETNTTIEGFEADFVWREARLIVELDGYATHGTRRAFERDRERDRRLTAAGWRTIRVTSRQLATPVALHTELQSSLSNTAA